MTTEEKAKAYDMALERAKEKIKDSGDNEGRKIMIRDIFPELAESKDERIRKELMNEICCLRASESKGSDRYESLTEMLAYLEKQKEQKHAPDDFNPN